MAMGYCKNCHQPIVGNQFEMVRGSKICLECLSKVKQTKEQLQMVARENDQNKEGLFTFLLSIFTIGKIPESWYNNIDSMVKNKLYTCQGIELSLRYCIQSGKSVNEDNWQMLVYTYYEEAQNNRKKREEIIKLNENKEIIETKKLVAIRNTNYRDFPKYKIEDL